MAILRVTQHIEQEDNYRVHIEFREADGSAQTAEARFAFQLTPSDRADLRWYLEDYLQYPMDPAPEIAARVEARLRELGAELFRNVFQANDQNSKGFASTAPHPRSTSRAPTNFRKSGLTSAAPQNVAHPVISTSVVFWLTVQA